MGPLGTSFVANTTKLLSEPSEIYRYCVEAVRGRVFGFCFHRIPTKIKKLRIHVEVKAECAVLVRE